MALSNYQWAAICLLAILYLLISARVAWRMGKLGHNTALWFLLTVFLTAVPATIVYWYHGYRRLQPGERGQLGRSASPPPRRCPRCGEILPPGGPDGAPPRCPRCGSQSDEVHLA